ncbi:hypothetical protein RFI_20112, partial [Reticulomyxa filosa]
LQKLKMNVHRRWPAERMGRIARQMEKLTKEKLVLIREIKTLRAQAEKQTKEWEEEKSALKALHLDEMTCKQKEMDMQLQLKQDELKQLQLQLQTQKDHFQYVHDLNNRYFTDVLHKLESFNFTLDNCAIEKLQMNTPGMTDVERRFKSNHILKQLLETLEENLKHEHVQFETSTSPTSNSDSNANFNYNETKENTEGSTNGLSNTNDTSKKTEPRNTLIQKLYRTGLELLCDKAVGIKKENDLFIKLHNIVLFLSLFYFFKCISFTAILFINTGEKETQTYINSSSNFFPFSMFAYVLICIKHRKTRKIAKESNGD